MKFAKQLEKELVPEWRVKYLDYKGGKKLIKQITKAINKESGTADSHRAPRRDYTLSLTHDPRPCSALQCPPEYGCPRPIPTSGETLSLTQNSPRFQYGSFVFTPPIGSPSPVPLVSANGDPLSLPESAVESPSTQTCRPNPGSASSHASTLEHPKTGHLSPAAEVRSAQCRSQKATLRGIFATSQSLSRRPWDQVKKCNEDFVSLIHAELVKVEDFYKLKEAQAGRRLDLLRDQLHEMRDRRTDELLWEQRRWRTDPADGVTTMGEPEADEGPHWYHQTTRIDPAVAKMFRPGLNSKALQDLPFTPVFRAQEYPSDNPDERRDYVRRPHDDNVSYRTAKRKLKLALKEFYRGLELLKAYALLNRTAFRKLNKKYDKAVNSRDTYKFMNEHVKKAWFINSNVLDQHVRTVEDLYARYFERGNYKMAVAKLRTKKGTGDESGSAFRGGLLIATGLVFAIQGAISGARILLNHADPGVRTKTSYVLQIYGGYFLILYLFFLFCLDCRQWTMSKVNYPFIFEFDARHNLDWRQLAEFPSFFTFLSGIILWLNLAGYWGQSMYLWWPVVLIVVTTSIILAPFPILGHRSRGWFVYSHWRLILAGLYPVEFRDFFLGDMYCSLTYALCNVELVFCLYGNGWERPALCNSSHSRLMGFFTALPPIWRALQCIRRYYDTRNIFPHLVNCGKYVMTIMSAVTLSMYRIRATESNLALFIGFSTVNAVYASFWDLFMDFSLMQAHSKNFLLRDIMTFKSKWVYWAIIIVDPILRFMWIFFAIFTHNVQHSALVSFMVAFAEVTRRGAWALFRVENEHASNVKQYKASRDVPLPYRIEPLVQSVDSGMGNGRESTGSERDDEAEPVGRASAVDEEAVATDVGQGISPDSGVGIKRRRAQSSAAVRVLGRILAEAHRQDFEQRKRLPGKGRGEADGGVGDDDDDDDDDEMSD